jgi:hypothetical protein
MVALLVALALAGPPKATLEGTPLAVSSWCWGTRCGAPIAASRRVIVVRRGATVRVALGFEPTQVRVAVAGAPVRATVGSRSIAWRAARSGGVSITVTGARGWVTYVGRIRLR